METKQEEAKAAMSKVPHGMRVKVLDENNNAIILCFASVCKDGKLADRIRAIDNAEREISEVARKARGLQNKAESLHGDYVSDDETKVAKARKQLELLMEDGASLNDKLSELQDAHQQAISDFYRASMASAGYTADEIEANLGYVTLDQYQDIRTLVRTGCGYVDFTKGGN